MCILFNLMLNGKIPEHYNDIIMSTMTSQINIVSIVRSTIFSGAYQRKHPSSMSLTLVGESTVTGGFPSHRASNIDNVFI